MSTKLPTKIREKLEELPPSASAVYQALYHSEEHLSTAEIHEATGIHERTVRNAVEELRNADLVARDEGIVDPRVPRYYITGRRE
jgi:predicted transcriptional regulator